MIGWPCLSRLWKDRLCRAFDSRRGATASASLRDRKGRFRPPGGAAQSARRTSLCRGETLTRSRGSPLGSSLNPLRAELGAGQKPKRTLPREAYDARSTRGYAAWSRVLACAFACLPPTERMPRGKWLRNSSHLPRALPHDSLIMSQCQTHGRRGETHRSVGSDTQIVSPGRPER